MPMSAPRLAMLALLVGMTVSSVAAGPLRFWNLTGATITRLELAPAGTQAWSANQTANDPDGAVDADERLKLSGIQPGRYDVRLTDKTGRTCMVRNVEVVADKPYAFSVSEQDLTDCHR
jgi:hypothetical protein